MRSHWGRYGPPLNIAALAIASRLGINWKLDSAPEPGDDHSLAPPPNAPTIAELAELLKVPAGHDTREASRLIVERLGHGRGQD